MFSLADILSSGAKKSTLSKKDIAKLLKTTPEAMELFEKSYQFHVLNDKNVSDNMFQVNSRQASAMRPTAEPNELCDELVSRIVDELLAQTAVYSYENGEASIKHQLALPSMNAVTQNDINPLPLNTRPQLTGTLAQVDTPNDASSTILWYYSEYLKAQSKGDAKKASFMYNHFRQGLDILDIDPISYAVIGMNENSMGYWLPALAEAVKQQSFFKIPNTKIAKIPLTLLQMTRLGYNTLTPTTIKIVNEFCKRAFALNTSEEYFIKTGTYSSKFDFRNAHVKGEKEVNELGEYLLYIHFQALQMASPLNNKTIYGVSTTNEWVVREFIQNSKSLPSIYKGMPLRTEYRVFVDFDTNEILGINPYWDPNVMKQRFGNEPDANDPDNIHDYIVYCAHEDKLMAQYNQNKELVTNALQSMLKNINLNGQWSIDVMQDGDEFYLIDMALAVNSALNFCVPAEKLNPVKENWLPVLSAPQISDGSGNK